MYAGMTMSNVLDDDMRLQFQVVSLRFALLAGQGQPLSALQSAEPGRLPLRKNAPTGLSGNRLCFAVRCYPGEPPTVTSSDKSDAFDDALVEEFGRKVSPLLLEEVDLAEELPAEQEQVHQTSPDTGGAELRR